jgi:hypothetical protein
VFINFHVGVQQSVQSLYQEIPALARRFMMRLGSTLLFPVASVYVPKHFDRNKVYHDRKSFNITSDRDGFALIVLRTISKIRAYSISKELVSDSSSFIHLQ